MGSGGRVRDPGWEVEECDLRLVLEELRGQLVALLVPAVPLSVSLPERPVPIRLSRTAAERSILGLVAATRCTARRAQWAFLGLDLVVLSRPEAGALGLAPGTHVALRLGIHVRTRTRPRARAASLAGLAATFSVHLATGFAAATLRELQRNHRGALQVMPVPGAGLLVSLLVQAPATPTGWNDEGRHDAGTKGAGG